MTAYRSIPDYTEREFYAFIEGIIQEGKCNNRRKLDLMIEHFNDVVGHPDGSDLIVRCPREEYDAAAILEKVKTWHFENNKPCFKNSNHQAL